MSEKQQNNQEATQNEAVAAPKKDLPPAALRALAEAEERRKLEAKKRDQAKKELGGRGGEDPARYGDWEINGRAIDF